MTHDTRTSAIDPDHENTTRIHDPLGAYMLGALPESEQIVFETHLRECVQCQQGVYELAPLVALLPRLYDDLDLPDFVTESVARPEIPDEIRIGVVSDSVLADPPTIAGVDQSIETAVPEIEDPVLPAIASPAVEAAAETSAEDTAVALKTRRRPRGRIAPGEAPPEAAVVSMPRERSSIIPWAIAAGSAILAIGAILWALAMMGQINSLKSERDLQDQQIVQLNQERQQYQAQTPAVVHTLVSTTAGSADMTGTVYLDPDPTGDGGIVSLRGMTQPAGGQVYQLWTITGGQMTAGPTFVPDSAGNVAVQIGNDAATAEQMAITIEPSGGSKTPTTSPIMQGNLKG